MGVKYLKHESKLSFQNQKRTYIGCKVIGDITDSIQFIGVTKPKLYLIELIIFLKQGSNFVNPCNSFQQQQARHTCLQLDCQGSFDHRVNIGRSLNQEKVQEGAGGCQGLHVQRPFEPQLIKLLGFTWLYQGGKSCGRGDWG